MNRQIISIIVLTIFLGTFCQFGFAQANFPEQDAAITEGNVWTTGDGQKFYTCPVMGGEGLVSTASSYSDVDGVRYYHCCAGCESKFQANSSEYLAALALPANILSVDESGKHFADPVSGKERVVTAKTRYHDQDGKRYYFASSRSMKKFCKTSSSSSSSSKSCSKSCGKPAPHHAVKPVGSTSAFNKNKKGRVTCPAFSLLQ